MRGCDGRLEEQTTEETATFWLLVEAAMAYGVARLDPGGRVMTWNAGVDPRKGYRVEDVIGRHFSIFYVEEDVARGRCEELLRTAATTGRANDECWHVRSDGSRFWAKVLIRALRDASGELRGFTKVTCDLTERRRFEDQLAVRARRQAAVAELGLFALKSRDLQSVMDRSVRIVADMLGADFTKVLELEPSGALRLRAGVGWRDGLVGHATVGSDADSQAGFTLRSGAPVVVLELQSDARFNGPALLREHGVVSGLSVIIEGAEGAAPYGVFGAHSRHRRVFSDDDIAFVQSITNVLASAIQRRHADEQLHAAEREAAQQRILVVQTEASVRERDAFLSIASHELRTPLTALVLHLQGLERTLENGQLSLRPKVQKALKLTHRLGSLVERLLDVSCLASGALPFSPEDVDLAKVVEDIVEDFREQARNTSSNIVVTIESRPEGRWDRLRLEQMLSSLLSNALKYGQGKPVHVGVSGDTWSAHLSVRDGGIGIAREDIDRIFNRFERAVSHWHYGGLGLGLYLVRQIVEAHGGQIRVSSGSGEGSAFEITLPRIPAGDQRGHTSSPVA